MADPTPVFRAAQMNTHMPFFDGNYLLFCGSEHVSQQEFPNRGEIVRRMLKDRRFRERFTGVQLTSRVSYRDWKLYYCSWTTRQPIRLNTALPQNFIECSPAMYRDGAQFIVSFIGGTLSDRALNYHLYTMQGTSLDSLSPAARAAAFPTAFGFVNAKYICVSRGKGIGITVKSTGAATLLKCSLQRILRVSYRADNADTLLISGIGADNAAKTIHYDLLSKETKEILSPVPVYKSSIVGDQLVVAVRAGATVEPYRLMSSSYTLADSKETVLAA